MRKLDHLRLIAVATLLIAIAVLAWVAKGYGLPYWIGIPIVVGSMIIGGAFVAFAVAINSIDK